MEGLQDISVSTVLLFCIAIEALLVYLPFLAVAYGRFQVGYDAAAPRALFDKLPAYAQRATWAHQNSFEAFMLFAAAALMAYVTQVDTPIATIAAIAHVVARCLFSPFYILNLPPLRSLMFAVGSLGTGTLIVLSLMQAIA
ncbi:MAG: MAPEG family protein [Elainellaceae cyanobacterium]